MTLTAPRPWLAAASSYSYADCLAAVTAVRLAASTAAGTVQDNTPAPRARKKTVSFAAGRTCELQYQHEGTGECLRLMVEGDSLPRGLPRPSRGKGGLASARLVLQDDDFAAVKSELVRLGLQRLQHKRKRNALGDEDGVHCKRSRPSSRAAELDGLEAEMVEDGLLLPSALPHFAL